jgi:hypothetical protein
MSNALSRTIAWFETSRLRLFLAWLLVSLAIGLPVTLGATIRYAGAHAPSEYYNWSTPGFCVATSLTFPIWLLISAPLPWGWLTYIGLVSTLITRSLTPLILAALGAAVAAAFWPAVYVMVASV